MGWLFTYGASKADVVKECTRGSERAACLAHSVYGNHLWSVWETKPADGAPPKRLIVLDLLGSSRGEGWGNKGMDESMGPYTYDCPLKFLDMVPVACQTWRDKVRAHHAAKSAKLKRKSQIKIGSTVRLTPGLMVRGLPICTARVIQVKPLRAETDTGCVVRLMPRHIAEVMAEG